MTDPQDKRYVRVVATRYDQLGKQMLRAGLESRGSFTPELEISNEPQYADGYFVSNLGRSSPIDGTLLGRIAEQHCSMENFSSPPDLVEMEGCRRKHYNLRHQLRKNPDVPGLPHQWIFSAGKPSAVLDATWARQADTWPNGVYELPPLDATSIVVLSELPEDRSTLLLRLLGRGRTLTRAIADLKTLSDDDFERCIALPLLVRFRFEVASAPVSPAEEEFLMSTQETFEMFERRVAQSGELRGELRGERKAVLRLLSRKFGVLPEDLVVRVQNAGPSLLAELEDKVLFANSLDELFKG